MLKPTFVFFLLCLLTAQSVIARDDYEIVIERSKNLLFVEKNGQAIKSFHVALGSGGRKGKQREGDKRTPMGTYHVMQIRDSDRFHFFIQLDYPSVRDAINALKDKRIKKTQYRKILDAHIYGEMPPQNTSLGGVIGIHGIGVETKEKIEIHEMANWTKGCIALRNSEIEQLLRYVKKGTTVTITE